MTFKQPNSLETVVVQWRLVQTLTCFIAMDMRQIQDNSGYKPRQNVKRMVKITTSKKKKKTRETSRRKSIQQ